MLQRLSAVIAITETLARDLGGLLASQPEAQVDFAKSLADNFVERVLNWPEGLIPRDFTEHGFSEQLVERGLLFLTLPVTLPVCFPAILISSALKKISPDE